MPLICPRCGAQNADGTAFCQNCAQPLAAGAAGPPPGAPPPGYGQYPPGYPNPYYAPAGPPPRPVHRVSWLGIMGSIIGTLGVLTACAAIFLHPNIGPFTPPVLPTPIASATSAPLPTATALAVATMTNTPPPTATTAATATFAPTGTPALTATPAAGNTPTPTDTPAAGTTSTPTDTPAAGTTSTPTDTDTPAAGNTPTPTDTDTPAATDTPVPKPTHTPRPTHTPVSTNTPPPTSTPAPPRQPVPAHGGHRVSTNTFTLRLLAHWSMVKKTKVDVLLANANSGGTGLLYIGAGTVSTPVTVQSLLSGIIANLGKQFPDATICGKSAPYTVGGVVGAVVPVCYTYIPQGGSGFPAVSLLWGATNAKGTTIYLFQAQFASSDKVFADNTAQLLRTVTWTVS